MKKFLLTALIVLLFPLSCSAFKYAGVGIGPAFSLKGFEGTNYFINAEWNPHDNIGTRFMVGFPKGLWLGVGLNFTYTTTDRFSKSFKISFNGGIPFILNIHETYKVAFMGINAGTSFLFDTDGRGIYYIYITPAEFFFSPVTWVLSPGGGFDLTSNISLITAVGFRAEI